MRKKKSGILVEAKLLKSFCNFFVLSIHVREGSEKGGRIEERSIVRENHEVYVRQKYAKKWYAKYVAIRRQ